MGTTANNNIISFNQVANSLPVISEELHQKSFTNEVANLCMAHRNNKKWILVIDGEEQAISALNKQQEIDKSKILHINNRKVKVNANNIETALAKGNCSAVVLGKNNFQAEQITYLNACAKQSNTTFVVLDNASGLH